MPAITTDSFTPKSKPKFTIRPFTTADFSSCASLAADAFIDDDVFGRFMYPHRREYWDDYINSWKGRITTIRKEGGDVVVVTEKDSGGEEKIVGWGAWCVMDLRPEKDNGDKNGAGLVMEVVPLADANTTITTNDGSGLPQAPVDRSASLENIAIFEAAKPHADHLWSGPFAHCYHLDLLCIAPSSQGKGYGAALVKWGIAEAEKKSIAASVIAAWQREEFYGRYGFVQRGWASVGPLEGLVKGGAVMFRMKDVKA